ncbi:hypothetical protein BKA64DRAFT_712359 [Cadophora sp. MPI-SDFR-AT-0126]|nr:hypothetical protein BKA64DRAFT_712359 [Leotiomycetes sp. MPI-SDFR-AT-0126]
MSFPTPTYPLSWRANHNRCEDEDPESSPEEKSPLSSGPYPDLIYNTYSNTTEDTNLTRYLDATRLEDEDAPDRSILSSFENNALDPELVRDGGAGSSSLGLPGNTVLDPHLFDGSSARIKQAGGGIEQPSGRSVNAAGSPNESSSNIQTPPSSRIQAPSIPSLGASLPLPEGPHRVIGPHTTGEAPHCCGFLLEPEPQGLSTFRLKLLCGASYLSQWTGFRDANMDRSTFFIAPGKWVYEVRQSTVLQDGTMIQQRHIGFFYYGDGSCPIPYRLSTTGDVLRSQYNLACVGSQQLSVQCRRPGHSRMFVLAWMTVADFNSIRMDIYSDTMIQSGVVGGDSVYL